MLTEDIKLKLFNFKSYLPIFIQWDPLTNVPPFPLPNDTVADGVLYEVTNESNLLIGDTTYCLKKHDLIARINGEWEHVDMEERNRLRFETWLINNDVVKNKPIFNIEELLYTSKNIQSKWIIWQAALNTTISG